MVQKQRVSAETQNQIAGGFDDEVQFLTDLTHGAARIRLGLLGILSLIFHLQVDRERRQRRDHQEQDQRDLVAKSAEALQHDGNRLRQSRIHE